MTLCVELAFVQLKLESEDRLARARHEVADICFAERLLHKRLEAGLDAETVITIALARAALADAGVGVVRRFVEETRQAEDLHLGHLLSVGRPMPEA